MVRKAHPMFSISLLRLERLRLEPYGRAGLREYTLAQPLTSTLGTSIMEAQLSNQQCITFDAVHHAVFVSYAA